MQVRAFDDLDLPWSEPPDGGGRGGPLVASGGEDALDEREQLSYGLQDKQTAVAILNVGRVDGEVEHQAERVDNDVTLLAFDFLAGIVAGGIDAPPLFPHP